MGVSLPLNKVLLLLRVDQCKVFDSKMKPLLLTYHNLDKGEEKLLKVIFKHGDGEQRALLVIRATTLLTRCVIRDIIVFNIHLPVSVVLYRSTARHAHSADHLYYGPTVAAGGVGSEVGGVSEWAGQMRRD